MSIKNLKSPNQNPYQLERTTTDTQRDENVPLTFSAWTRPSDWVSLPTVTSSNEKFVGIWAVGPSQSLCAIYCETDTGTFTVDWGDGTANSVGASGATVYHIFDYTTAALSATTSTRGYKQSIITVTPTTGHITRIDLSRRHNATQAQRYASMWLDIALSLPYCTYISIGQDEATYPYYLEQISIYKYSDSWEDLSYLFRHCKALQSIPVFYAGTAAKYASYMFNDAGIRSVPTSMTAFFNQVMSCIGLFQSCYSLVTAEISLPLVYECRELFYDCRALKRAVILDLGSSTTVSNDGSYVASVDASNMFASSSALNYVAIYKTSKVRTFGSCFSQCYNLENVYIDPNTSILLVVDNMFNSCQRIRSLPYFYTKNVVYWSAFATSCYQLEYVPPYDFSGPNWPAPNGETRSYHDSMFSSCYTLKQLPQLNFTRPYEMGSAFADMWGLEKFPDMTGMANNVNGSYMFYQCYRLQNAGPVVFSSLVDAGHMFRNCQSLLNADITISNTCTSFSNMFSGDYSLQNVTISGNTARVTTTDNMFSYCQGMTSITLFDTSRVTNMDAMFYECNSLQIIPTFNTGNCTNFNSMMRHCYLLEYPPAIDTSKGTSFQYTFESSYNIKIIPTLNTANGTNFDNFASNCWSLKTAPTMNLYSSTYTRSMFNACYSLQAANNISNIKQSIDFQNCSLSNTALNDIYTALNTVSGKTIFVNNNWGTTSDTTSIATAKGWTVSG